MKKILNNIKKSKLVGKALTVIGSTAMLTALTSINVSASDFWFFQDTNVPDELIKRD